MKYTDKDRSWNSRLKHLSVKWKIILLSTLLSGIALVSGFTYFTYQSYWLNVTTALDGLMNFTDSKQQGVIRFIDQNKKLAKQLASDVEQANTKTLQNQFHNIVSIDVFRLDDHPFKDEIIAGTRNIPTWNVYHSIDFVSKGVIVVSSDPLRIGKLWNKSVDKKIGYTEPYYDGTVPVMTFAAQSTKGAVYVNVDARMLTNIVSGEIGNLAGIGAYYLAGVGKTFDYYIVNKDNLLITESRARSGQFLKGKGSTLPWLTTLERAGVVCGKSGVYTTDAKCTTGCREAMGFYIGPAGNKMLGASMPFYDSSWTLVVEQEANELLMPMWLAFAQVIGMFILLGSIAVYISFLLVNKLIISPLHSLQAGIENINQSNDFSKTINVDSGDEIGKLGNSFNSMSTHLHNLYSTLDERIEDRTQKLNITNKQLQEEIIERKIVEKEIENINKSLESKVIERTTKLEVINKDLESFSYSISHDLRSPLRAISGFSKILQEDYAEKLDKEGIRLLNIVGDNAQKMGELIDDILAFSRAGRDEVELTAIDMKKMAEGVWEELIPNRGGRAVHFEIGDIAAATGDSAAIHQVIYNLLSNAIKYTQRSTRALVEVGSYADGLETVYYVKDNGVGFDMQYANMLFGVFKRLHGADEFEGTGIGLAIIKRIINKHGGRVWAEGKPNEGATFYFSLLGKEK